MLETKQNRPQWIMASAVFATIVSFYLVAAVRFPMLYIWATYEDLVGEWIQFWCLAVSFALSLRLATKRWQFRWFFVLLAGACFYASMEEISWGQRILNFSSPEYFRTKNLQGETNFHNFLTGPYATPLKAMITYALSAALFGYGLLYPLALKYRWRLATWLTARGIPSPPLYACPFFIGGAILEIGPFRFNEAEVAEILVGVGLVLMTVQYVYSRQLDLAPKNAPRSPTPLCRVTSRQGIALALILALSAGTTTAIYASPNGSARIDKRIRAGMKKFAGRYARYEQWNIASDFYERLLVDDPQDVFLLRKLAESCKKDGDQKRFDKTLGEVLEIDLARYSKDPKAASVNRSLARTYRMLGLEAKADAHIQEALTICAERVKKNPNSASAAFSLGKTYTLLGRHGAALEQISKASRLNPSSKRIRKAYFRAKRKLAEL